MSKKITKDKKEKISWVKIEKEYVTDINKKPITLEELSKKYNISDNRIRKYSMENKWSEKRTKYKQNINRKVIEKTEKIMTDDILSYKKLHLETSMMILNALNAELKDSNKLFYYVDKLRVTDGNTSTDFINEKKLESINDKKILNLTTALEKLQKMQRETLGILNVKDELELKNKTTENNIAQQWLDALLQNENCEENLLSSRQEKYRKNPVLFCNEVLSFTPDEWQKEVLLDIANSDKVSIRSGQGVGKTSLEACILLWFLSCFKNAKIVATAPTMQQLFDVLWAEVSKWLNKSQGLKEILEWTKTKVYMKNNSDRWFATAKTATRAENMQGYHEDNMLFIVDEASGVADPIMEAILGTLSGVNNKLLLCSNPTKTTGTFFDSHHRDRSLYKTHAVNSLNVERTNKENIQSLIKKYGENSNVVRVRIYGEFPVDEDDVMIPLQFVMNAINYEYEIGEIESIHISADIARFGEDKTVIGSKINEKIEFNKIINGQDTMRTASDIAILFLELQEKYKFRGIISVKIDDSGVGGGVTDRLRQIKKSESNKYKNMDILPIQFGRKIKHKYFDDSTTLMMGILKDLLSIENEDKRPHVKLPDNDDLIGQLSCRKYYMTDQSKMRIESKKDMKARNIASPDEADCVLLLCLPVNTNEKVRNGINY